MNRSIRLFLMIYHFIIQAEFEEPTWNQYVRSVDEFKAPFLNENSTVYREGLRLIFLETKIFPCDLQERLKQCGANGTYAYLVVCS